MKKDFKKKMPIIIFLLLTIFYFEYSVTILWDSAHYMNYVNIMEGIIPLNNWDVVRGPVFPMIIFLGNTLFGKTAQGLIMNTYIYYLVMLVFVYKIINYVFDNFDFNEKKKKKISIVILCTIIFNPIVFGFYHSLLTEFVAITLSLISCYLAVIWCDTDYTKKTKKYICISVLFAFLTVFSWFLKQPYVSCGLFPLIISYFISLFYKKGFKNFLIRTSSVVLCIVVLFASIKTWNVVLLKMGNDPTTNRNPSVSLGNTLISGLGFTKIDNSEEIRSQEYIQSENKLSDSEKIAISKLIEDKQEYIIINIYDADELVAADYIKSNDGNVSTVDAMIYIFKYFVNEPLTILDSYLTNYLSIIDIYSTSSEDGVGYSSNKKIKLDFSNEITTIAFKPYYYGADNVFYMLPEMRERVDCYEQINYTFKPINYMMLILGKVFLVVFKLSFILLPFALIASVVLKSKKKMTLKLKKNLNLVIILLGFSFLHMLLHTVTGAIIDRYAVPSFITTMLGIVLLLINLFQNKTINKDK